MHVLPIPLLSDPNDARAAQVFVDVEADGIPVRMLLDSGTPRSWIPHRDSVDIIGSENGKPLVRLEKLQWGSLTVPDLVVAMNPPGWPHPPLLGMDVLGSHACHFRFSAGVLELDGAAPAGELLPLPTTPCQTPTVSVRWRPDTFAEALWDTGAGIAFVDRPWADEHPEIVAITEEFGTGTDIHGATGRNRKGRFVSCRIGPIDFAEQSCGVGRLGFGNIRLTVGMPLISQADWYFDFPYQRWSNHRGAGTAGPAAW